MAQPEEEATPVLGTRAEGKREPSPHLPLPSSLPTGGLSAVGRKLGALLGAGEELLEGHR